MRHRLPTPAHEEPRPDPARSSVTALPEGLAASPRQLRQRQQVAQINDSPLQARQRAWSESLQRDRAGPGAVLQRKPAAGRVQGLSHLVRMQSGQLHAEDLVSNEGPEVQDGQPIRIDDERIHVSRRGPNQENFAALDENGPAQYPWYAVLALDTEELPQGFFVRADAVRLGEGGQTPKLTQEQAQALDLPLPHYMASQQAYQNSLAEQGLSQADIYDNHRSVGLEFEFAKHDQKNTASHIVLAQSDPFSTLYGLRFVLETDSGDVLELGLPPLLFRNRLGGGPNAPAISMIYKKVQDEVNTIGKSQNLDLDELQDQFQAKGLGSGWRTHASGKLLKLKTVDKSTVDKFGERGIYSQMNISMTSAESGSLLHSMSGPDVAKGSAESGVLGARYAELLACMTGQSSPLAKIHLAKSFANLFAGLDILRAGGMPLSVPESLALQSTVKELHGVWIKDVPSNVLMPFRDRGEIDAADVRAAAKYSEEKLIADCKALDQSIPNLVLEAVRAVERAMTPEYTKGCLVSVESSLKTIAGELGDDCVGTLKEISARLDKLVDDEDDPGFYGVHNDELKPWVAELLRRAQLNGNISGPAQEALLAELMAMTNLILGAVGPLKAPPSHFGAEALGSGTGVRKDTHLDPILDEDGKPAMSVAELRSDYVINKFFEQS